MAYFELTSELLTGNTLIDSDHRKLVDMINAFYEAMQAGQASDAIGKVLNNLLTYTREHFGREEQEMRRINYAMSANHKLEHTKLIKQVADLKAQLESGVKPNAVAIGRFLSDWLHNHILSVDVKLAAALRG